MKPIFDVYAGKSKDDLWFRHWRLQHLIIMTRLRYYRPDLLTKEARREFKISDVYYFSLEREYLNLCAVIGLPNTLVINKYPEIEGVNHQPPKKRGAMLNYPGVRMLLQRYGTNEAISEYPWK